MAEVHGFGYLSYDKSIRKVYYTEEERQNQFNSLPQTVQEIIQAYADGVNTYFQFMEDDPDQYLPLEVYQMQQDGWTLQPWSVTDCIAIHQYFCREFGQFGGHELTRLAELENHGWQWFNENRPLNNPNACTTIPDEEAGDDLFIEDWQFTNVNIDFEIINLLAAEQAFAEQVKNEFNMPAGFGSYAVQIGQTKSATNNVMLLGCPQMGGPSCSQTNIICEVELFCPGLHIGGMTIAGMPFIVIGHNENFGWSLTSGYSDNTDVFIDSTQDQSCLLK